MYCYFDHAFVDAAFVELGDLLGDFWLVAEQFEALPAELALAFVQDAEDCADVIFAHGQLFPEELCLHLLEQVDDSSAEDLVGQFVLRQ